MNDIEFLQHSAQEAERDGLPVTTFRLLAIAKELQRLQEEIRNAWDELAFYGTDSREELAEEDETAEDVKLVTGVQQLGEVAYQWRNEAAEAGGE